MNLRNVYHFHLTKANRILLMNVNAVIISYQNVLYHSQHMRIINLQVDNSVDLVQLQIAS